MNEYAVMVVPPPLHVLMPELKRLYRMQRWNDPRNVIRRARYVSKAKFRPGKVIRTLDDLVKQKMVYVGMRHMDVGWVKQWPLSYAMRLLERGSLRFAVKRETENKEN